MTDFDNKLNQFTEYMQEWANKSGDTISHYKRFTKEFLEFANKNYGIERVADLSPKHLIEFIKYLKQRGLSGSTINLKRHAIISFISALYNLDPENEIWRTKLFLFKNIKGIGKVETQQHEPIPVSLLPALRDASLRLDKKENCTEYYTFFIYFLYTGGRSQLYGVKVDEINLKNNWIETYVKGRKKIKIPIHPTLKKVIQYHLKNRNYESEYLFKHGKYPYVPHDYEREKDNKDSNRKNTNNICKAIMREAGIKEVTKYICIACKKSYNKKIDRCKECNGKIEKKTTGLIYICPSCDNAYIKDGVCKRCKEKLMPKEFRIYPHAFRETLHYYFEELDVSENTAMAIGGWNREDMARLYRRKGKHVKKAVKELEKIDLLKIAEENGK